MIANGGDSKDSYQYKSSCLCCPWARSCRCYISWQLL